MPSFISYNITRSYPYSWLTPAVFVGGVIALALVSFLSVATQGYETIAVYLPEPNITDKSSQTIFAKWPSYLTANTKSLCSTTALPVNSEFYTNNTILTYKLSAVWQGAHDVVGRSMAGSLPYNNQQLQDCSVGAIEIDYLGIERAGLQIARQQWGATLKAYISCAVPTPDGFISVNMTTSYDFNPAEQWIGSVNGFPGRNSTSKPSLWWGESLFAWYSIAATRDMELTNQNFSEPDDTPPVYKGYVSLVPTITKNATAEQITSLDFFRAGCYFITFSDNGVENPMYVCTTSSVSELMNADQSNPGKPLPGIWLSSDTLAKAFYFTVLADLGQQSSGPNILTDPDLLAYFTKNISTISATPKPWGAHMGPGNLIGLSQKPFTASDPTASALRINPSVISTEYLCQIPRLKSTSTLVVSVLINDLVILSTIWKIAKLVIDHFLVRKRSDMNYCEGCAGRGSTYLRDHEYQGQATEMNNVGGAKSLSRPEYIGVRDSDPDIKEAGNSSRST